MSRFLTNTYSNYTPKVVGDTLEREEAVYKTAAGLYQNNIKSDKTSKSVYDDLNVHNKYNKTKEEASKEYREFSKKLEEDGRYEFAGRDIDKTNENITEKYHLKEALKNSEAIRSDFKFIDDSEHTALNKERLKKEALDYEAYEEDGITPKKYGGAKVADYVNEFKAVEEVLEGWKADKLIEPDGLGGYKILSPIPGMEGLLNVKSISGKDIRDAASLFLQNDEKIVEYQAMTSRLDAKDFINNTLSQQDSLTINDILKADTSLLPLDYESMMAEIRNYTVKAKSNNLSEQEILKAQKDIKTKYELEALEEFTIQETDALENFKEVYGEDSEQDYIKQKIQQAFLKQKQDKLTEFFANKLGFREEDLKLYKKAQDEAYENAKTAAKKEEEQQVLNVNISKVITSTDKKEVASNQIKTISELRDKEKALEEELKNYEVYLKNVEDAEKRGEKYTPKKTEEGFVSNYDVESVKQRKAQISLKKDKINETIKNSNRAVISAFNEVAETIPTFSKEADFPTEFIDNFKSDKYQRTSPPFLNFDKMFQASLGSSFKKHGKFDVNKIQEEYINNAINYHLQSSFKVRNEKYQKQFSSLNHGSKSSLDSESYLDKGLEQISTLNEILKIGELTELVAKVNAEKEKNKNNSDSKNLNVKLVDELNQSVVEILNSNKNNNAFQDYFLSQIDELDRNQDGNWFQTTTGIKDSNPLKPLFKVMEKYNPKVNVQSDEGYIKFGENYASLKDNKPLKFIQDKLDNAVDNITTNLSSFTVETGQTLDEIYQGNQLVNVKAFPGTDGEDGAPTLYITGEAISNKSKTSAKIPFNHVIKLEGSPMAETIKNDITLALEDILDIYLNNPDSIKEDRIQQSNFNNLLSSVLAFRGIDQELLNANLNNLQEGQVSDLNLESQNLQFLGMYHQNNLTYGILENNRIIYGLNGEEKGNGKGIYGYLRNQVDNNLNPLPGQEPRYIDYTEVIKQPNKENPNKVELDERFIPAKFQNPTEMVKNMFTNIIVNNRKAKSNAIVAPDWQTRINNHRGELKDYQKLNNINSLEVKEALKDLKEKGKNFERLDEAFGFDYFSSNVMFPYFSFEGEEDKNKIKKLIKGEDSEIKFTNQPNSSLFITGGSDHESVNTGAKRKKHSNHYEGRALDVLATPAMRDLYQYWLNPNNRLKLLKEFGIKSIYLDDDYKVHYHINF